VTVSGATENAGVEKSQLPPKSTKLTAEFHFQIQAPDRSAARAKDCISKIIIH